MADILGSEDRDAETGKDIGNSNSSPIHNVGNSSSEKKPKTLVRWLTDGFDTLEQWVDDSVHSAAIEARNNGAIVTKNHIGIVGFRGLSDESKTYILAMIQHHALGIQLDDYTRYADMLATEEVVMTVLPENKRKRVEPKPAEAVTFLGGIAAEVTGEGSDQCLQLPLLEATQLMRREVQYYGARIEGLITTTDDVGHWLEVTRSNEELEEKIKELLLVIERIADEDETESEFVREISNSFPPF